MTLDVNIIGLLRSLSAPLCHLMLSISPGSQVIEMSNDDLRNWDKLAKTLCLDQFNKLEKIEVRFVYPRSKEHLTREALDLDRIDKRLGAWEEKRMLKVVWVNVSTEPLSPYLKKAVRARDRYRRYEARTRMR